MVVNAFEALMNEFSEAVGINLKPEGDACVLKLRDGLLIRFEYRPVENDLLVFSILGSVPPGRYRESLFRAALISNGLPYPRYGVFAFHPSEDQLILYFRRSLIELNGVKIAYAFTPFVEKARTWRDAITSNSIPGVTAYR